jgi:predicted membrane protein
MTDYKYKGETPERNYKGQTPDKKSRTFFFAMLVIVAGVLLLINGLVGLPYEFTRIFITWQMLLIVIGIYNLFTPQHKTSGIILIARGSVFLINRLGIFYFNVWNVFWPVILIIVGIAILLKHRRTNIPGVYNQSGGMGDNEPEGAFTTNKSDLIDEVSVFSGSEKTITSKNFRGGKITSIFGGSELNLTQAELSTGNNTIDMFCMFGGTTLIVPSDWEINVDVTAIFGGYTDKRYKGKSLTPDNTKRLNITGLVLFGGGEIKSY